jgi:hypothetical protein
MLAVLAALAAVAPALATAGSISGTVTDSVSHTGIQGVEVCPIPQPYTFEIASCAVTGPSGQYRYDGLPASNYIIYFSADRANLKYVSEYYDGKASYQEAELFNLGPAEDKTLDVDLAEGGSISGTATDETTTQPIAGLRACAIDHEGIPGRCADTGPSGEYQLNGLRSGVYNVEYEGGNRVNYLSEFYEDAETWAAAKDVTVTAPATVPGIDAKLAPGAQILGHVSEVGTEAARSNVRVCVSGAPPREYETCASTDAAGNYAMRSIPAGTYLVSFDVEYAPITGLQIYGQWWQGAPTRADATPITIAPPETRTGIDGRLPKRFESHPPDPIQVSLIPGPPPVRGSRCRKGFHKKRVKAKVRCVRRRHHGHQHAPHAHATKR